MTLNVFLQDDPDVVLTEDDFRRRRPHANFKELSAAEKNVLRLGKTVSRGISCTSCYTLNELHFLLPSVVVEHNRNKWLNELMERKFLFMFSAQSCNHVLISLSPVRKSLVCQPMW